MNRVTADPNLRNSLVGFDNWQSCDLSSTFQIGLNTRQAAKTECVGQNQFGSFFHLIVGVRSEWEAVDGHGRTLDSQPAHLRENCSGNAHRFISRNFERTLHMRVKGAKVAGFHTLNDSNFCAGTFREFFCIPSKFICRRSVRREIFVCPFDDVSKSDPDAIRDKFKALDFEFMDGWLTSGWRLGHQG
nr:hypothetical protein [Ruegeria sp. A3M17]